MKYIYIYSWGRQKREKPMTRRLHRQVTITYLTLCAGSLRLLNLGEIVSLSCRLLGIWVVGLRSLRVIAGVRESRRTDGRAAEKTCNRPLRGVICRDYDQFGIVAECLFDCGLSFNWISELVDALLKVYIRYVYAAYILWNPFKLAGDAWPRACILRKFLQLSKRA